MIFGVPAEADQAFRNTLAEIARKAGYGSIETREEPLGAMFYHVSHKGIAPSDAMRGLLVIDFGGGTCDFAFIYRGKIFGCWGERARRGPNWLPIVTPPTPGRWRRGRSCPCRTVKSHSLRVRAKNPFGASIDPGYVPVSTHSQPNCSRTRPSCSTIGIC